MLLGVGAMGAFLSQFSDYYFHIDSNDDDSAHLSVNIDEDVFNEMDTNADGRINRSEYRAYVLVKHGLVSKDILDGIDAEYNLLDDGGMEAVTLDMITRKPRRRSR
mmetsp:Transcript_96948/g.209099  ORF Transcript_96948/g.209099 Transcript_96948/m.209099 type:complete len:106 (+) Transcript_96948:2-319(+)